MLTNRQGLLSSANRRIRRARRSIGRIMASVLGFGVAYYFDTENGALRRTWLRQLLQRTARSVDSVMAPEAGDPPPSFSPMLRGLRPDGPATASANRERAVATTP